MTTLALVDDYPGTGLGHHPDLIVGIAEASLGLLNRHGPTRIYCPPTFIADRTIPDGIVHRPFIRAERATAPQQRERMAAVCRDAAEAGAEVLVNLFFDESHESFPVSGHGLRIVQALHRPTEFGVDVVGADPDRQRDVVAYLRRTAPADLFVVHTRAAYEEMLRWLPPERLLQLAWPAASIAEVTERFAAVAPVGEEPHVLLIGDARDAKGIHELLTALADGGPMLRIVGQQPDGVESALRQRYPSTKVDWETGWISRSRLGEAISAASVLVFPYLKTFGQHGGVSGALAQALTFGKPLVVSSVLSDQLPTSDAVRIVEPGDVADLRQAVDWALRNSAELHKVAERTLEQVREHTYDRHLERILARVAV